MNRSKPSTELGGGEMNRATSSVVSSAKSDGASDVRISRSATVRPTSTGSPSRQSVLTTSVVAIVLTVTGAVTGSTSSSGRYGIFSMAVVLLGGHHGRV